MPPTPTSVVLRAVKSFDSASSAIAHFLSNVMWVYKLSLSGEVDSKVAS